MTVELSLIDATTTGRVLTGMRHIDGALGDGEGIPSGIVVDVFGGHGTGKTQMLHHAATRFAVYGRRVLYVDTLGTFRPERILQMAGGILHPKTPESILEAISVARVQSVYEQIEVVDSLVRNTDGFGLVIIDSLTDLFLYEYSRYGDLKERNRAFFKHMRSIARLAVDNCITVMASNMVHTSGGADSEVMAAEVGLFAHVRIHLVKKEPAPRCYSNVERFEGHILCAMRDAAQDGEEKDNDDDDVREQTKRQRGVDYDYDNNGSRLTIPVPRTVNDDFDKSVDSQKPDVVFTYEILATGIRTKDVQKDGEYSLP